MTTDPRVRVVASTFLEHAARKSNPVPVPLLREKLFAGDHSEFTDWVDEVVRRGKARVLVDGAAVDAWPGSAAREAFRAAAEDRAAWARYALDVKI